MSSVINDGTCTETQTGEQVDSSEHSPVQRASWKPCRQEEKQRGEVSAAECQQKIIHADVKTEAALFGWIAV